MSRVLVVRSDLLLTAGIVSILEQQEGIEVLGIAYKGIKQTLKEIKTIQPDVLILDNYLFAPKTFPLPPLFEDFPKMRIVVIDVDENKIQIYSKREVNIRQFSDLVAEVL